MKQRFVQLTEKINRANIFVSTVFVRNPFAIITVIIQIEHGRHCINSDTVDVIFVKPE